MASTHGDRIEKLENQLHAVQLLDERIGTANTIEILAIQERLKELSLIFKEERQVTSKLTERLIAAETQIKTLEKQSDRHWQVWLALGSAIVALLVAFLKK